MADKKTTSGKKTTKKGNDKWKSQGAVVPVDLSKIKFANKPSGK